MRVVISNCPADIAESLAASLIDDGLAACVNVLGPVTSVFRWEGRRCVETERTLVIKVAAARAPALVAALRERHPYEVPEILAFPVDLQLSDPRYVGWVRDAGGPDDASSG